MSLLQDYSWPGNVRQLENVIERAIALETTEAVLPDGSPSRSGAPRPRSRCPRSGTGSVSTAYLLSVEARLLGEALDRARGDRGRRRPGSWVSPRSLR